MGSLSLACRLRVQDTDSDRDARLALAVRQITWGEFELKLAKNYE